MSLRQNLHQEVCGYLTHLCKAWEGLTAKCAGQPGPIGEETAADVRVRIRRSVIAVEVESAVVLVLVVVSTDVEHNPAGVVVAVVAMRTGNRRETPDYW